MPECYHARHCSSSGKIGELILHTKKSLERRIVRCNIDWSGAGMSLIDFLSSRFTYQSREKWVEHIENNELMVNGKIGSCSQILLLHDTIEYQPPELPEPPADFNYKVVYEDEVLAVVDKPGNLCIHPSGPFFRNTLWRLLSERYGEVHFLNRLDRETSGLVLVALNSQAAAKLNKLREQFTKEYQVLVHGRFEQIIEANGFLISDGAEAIRKKRRFVWKIPPEAVKVENVLTWFTPETPGDEFSLVRARLGTGRMHQIRATLLALGYPVAGDKLYGLDEQFYLKQRVEGLTNSDRQRLVFPRQMLHASDLSFPHPVSGKIMNFSSPAPFKN